MVEIGGVRGCPPRRGGGGRRVAAATRGILPPSMPLRKAVLDARFEDCGECEQGYAVLGLEFLDAMLPEVPAPKAKKK